MVVSQLQSLLQLLGRFKVRHIRQSFLFSIFLRVMDWLQVRVLLGQETSVLLTDLALCSFYLKGHPQKENTKRSSRSSNGLYVYVYVMWFELHIHICMCAYIYIYMCVCAYVWIISYDTIKHGKCVLVDFDWHETVAAPLRMVDWWNVCWRTRFEAVHKPSLFCNRDCSFSYFKFLG